MDPCREVRGIIIAMREKWDSLETLNIETREVQNI